MPPEQEPEFDAVAILSTLARHRVQFVVIGGYAAQLAGALVDTEDVDITPSTAPENLERLAAALAELDAGIRVDGEPPVPFPFDGRMLAGAQVWNLTTKHGDLDISTVPTGTDGFPDLRRGAAPRRVAPGLSIDVASLEDIIRSKTAANRPKDATTLPELHRALERERNDLEIDL